MLETLAGAGPAAKRAAQRIVVVDDDPVLRAIVRAMARTPPSISDNAKGVRSIPRNPFAIQTDAGIATSIQGS